MKLPSKGHKFSEVPKAEIPRSSFDRSHGVKTTFDSGYLVPIFWDEVLPGDTFKMNLRAFARMATPVYPVMDNIWLSTFFFFVPNRLLWTNWEKFNGAQDNPADSTDYTVPVVQSPVAGYNNGTLFDYFGLPTKIAATYDHVAFYSRAYNLIWNEWFRDQNLQNSVTVDVGDGPDDPTNYVLLKRGKRHDYFTSSLPWPQKGDPVDIPIGTTAPVQATGNLQLTDGTVTRTIASRSSFQAIEASVAWPAGANPPVQYASGMEVDLSSATAATINQLRQAFQVQRLLERDARGGTRYTELVKAHFGVTSPDQRLQRPEYLGGGKVPVNVNPVTQTSSTDATSPQGNLAAFATASVNGHGFTRSFTEHGVVIGLAVAYADLTYQQGLNRAWSRSTRYDYFWPALAHIGEQAVLQKEIYLDGTAQDETVWGYQERYAEYRYKPSYVTGLFRSNDANSLDAWHLGLHFTSAPALNSTFIQEAPPIQRVVAVASPEPEFLFDAWFDFECARPMPVYGVPGLIDHF